MVLGCWGLRAWGLTMGDVMCCHVVSCHASSMTVASATVSNRAPVSGQVLKGALEYHGGSGAESEILFLTKLLEIKDLGVSSLS